MQPQHLALAAFRIANSRRPEKPSFSLKGKYNAGFKHVFCNTNHLVLLPKQNGSSVYVKKLNLDSSTMITLEANKYSKSVFILH